MRSTRSRSTRSRSSPRRRLSALAILVLALALVLSPAAEAGGPARRPADTWFQTIRFADGSSARIALSTRDREPRPGEGVDLGTVSAPVGPASAGAQLAPVDAESPAGPSRLETTAAAGGTGSTTAYGWVTYTNAFGVQLWKWVHQISWSYSAYKVTSVYNQFAVSLGSCCLWEYHGTISQGYSPPGGANFTAYAQGKYKACITAILCQTKLPWIWFQGNGNGVLTGFSWGIG